MPLQIWVFGPDEKQQIKGKDSMKQQKTQDMSSGSIPKLLAQLAVPAVVAQIVNLLYNIVDRIYIGHMADVGAAALTGVGLFTDPDADQRLRHAGRIRRCTAGGHFHG